MENLSVARWQLGNLRMFPGLTTPMMDQIEILDLELQFLKHYIRCLDMWNVESPGEKNKHLVFVRKFEVEFTLEEASDCLYSTCVKALMAGKFKDWDSLASELLDRIQHCKPMIKKDCLDWLESLDSSFRCKFLDSFTWELAAVLDEFVRLKADKMMVDIKMQIGGILEKTNFLKSMLTENKEDLKDFKILIQTWVLNATCLSLVNWAINEKEDEMPPRMNNYFTDLQQKSKPSTPEVMKMYLAALKCLPKSSWGRHNVNNAVLKLADLILENFQLIPLMDETQNLHRALVFLMKVLVDRLLAEKYTEDAKLIAKKVEHLICSLLLAANRFKGCSAEAGSSLLHDFLQKINIVKAEVRKFYAQIFLDSSSFNFPRTNIFGFIDSLLENLKEISVHFENHKIVNVEEEILSLKPLLKHILELQNEHKELKGLWTRIINVVYRAEISVNLFESYDIDHISGAIDEIKLIKTELKEIQDQHMYNINPPLAKLDSSPILPLQTNASRMDEVVVGHKDEAEIIVDRLTRGGKHLDIVSIVGMAGLGKTTITKKVCSDPRVRYHFNKFAWCFISQTYQKKRLLLEILSDLIRPERDLSEKEEEEELAERLYKCLKGQRYLIVMDDIWDIMAWDTLKESFPDDNNGSRIIFTSRIHNVVLQAKSDCRPHALRPLSYEESWELLQKKLFDKNFCPEKFSECGQEIARNCKGLPLAVVVVAGLLSKKVENFDWWIEIAKSLGSQFASEGCKGIIELSYKHLPEYLKPCFLYFGAFPEDRVVRVKRLIRLWISEGFIQKPKEKNLENVAKEYLMDLVARSLVIVTKKSSNGGIKTCLVHDLLHEFCLAKAREENFLQVEYGDDCFPNFGVVDYKQYRMCFWIGKKEFQNWYPSGPCIHSLLFFPGDPVWFSDWFYFSNLRLLQVLDLDHIQLELYFPEEITALVLLRYLTICCYSARSIPTTISNLKNLETFCIVRFGGAISLPHTFWTMKRLRHVEIGRIRTSPSGDCELEEFSALDNIKTFSCPSLSSGEDAVSLLRRISRVRKLRCRFHDSWDPQKRCNQFPVLDVLTQLESLNVEYYGEGLYPRALNFPSSLKKLTLMGFKLSWNEISIIEKLPNLEVLKLLWDCFQGENWDMEDGDFLNLKFLKLSELDIVHWNACDYPFPCLQQLVVEDCYNLEEIPYSFGEIPSLKVIKVFNCDSTVATSVRQIEEVQLDMGNEDLQVLITD